MKLVSSLLFVFCISWIAAQEKSLTEKRWFSLGLFSPTVGYSYYRIKKNTDFPQQTKPLYLDSRIDLLDLEVAKVRFIFFDQFSFGAQIFINSKRNKEKAQTDYQNAILEKHITNWDQKKLSHLLPRFFIGYRYPYQKMERRTHYIGCNLYLNLDKFNYGSYSYDAKNVNDNQFYHYEFGTSTLKNQSLTIEIDHSTKFIRRDESGTNVVVGIKAGFTSRNQTIKFTETFRDLNQTITSELDPLTFKSWSFHLGIIISPELIR